MIARPVPAVDKVVIAIHGIGDQAQNATILAAALRVCGFYQFPELLPLGWFSGTLASAHARAFVVKDGPPALEAVGFGEIYWADIGRGVEQNNDTIQETKAWAQSLVSRLEVIARRNEAKILRQKNDGHRRHAIHYGQIEFVLGEIIDTIRTLESLLYLAKKAGLFSFDLNNLLNNYLGDVQIVTEFQTLREEILGRLRSVLAAVQAQYPGAEIHLVAHSEGTVIAFLGLLQALQDPFTFPWIRQVRSFMTIGSPINKHVVLWPELFAKFTGPAIHLPKPIRWYNYCDNGDPVGFELDIARAWLEHHGYAGLAPLDFCFHRYCLPGVAHEGYWTDADVFDHYLLNAVSPTPETPPGAARRRFLRHGPPNLWWPAIISYTVSYAVPAFLVLLACGCLLAGVRHFALKVVHLDLDALRDWVGLSVLLMGTTVWLRLQQLVRPGALAWHAIGAAVYALGAVGAYCLFGDPPGAFLNWLDQVPEWVKGTRLSGILYFSVALILVVLVLNLRVLRKAFRTRLGTQTRLARLAWSGAKPVHEYPDLCPPPVRNTLTLMLGLMAALLIGDIVMTCQSGDVIATGWLPMALGLAAFLFLWRLAALLFDLVFVWHRYIRNSGLNDFLYHEVAPMQDYRKANEPAPTPSSAE